MNRKKVILSIFLMLFLAVITLVLPSIWKNRNAEKPSTEKMEPPKETPSDSSLKRKFIDFAALKAFFSDSQIASLKEQFPAYLAETGIEDLTHITFLPDKTSYPTETSVCLLFNLSDDRTLPVTYHTPTGVFLFGEEGTQIATESSNYEKPTDDSLPVLTPEDIHSLQEGGYPDTTDNPVKPDSASESSASEKENSPTSVDTNKEVQP